MTFHQNSLQSNFHINPFQTAMSWSQEVFPTSFPPACNTSLVQKKIPSSEVTAICSLSAIRAGSCCSLCAYLQTMHKSISVIALSLAELALTVLCFALRAGKVLITHPCFGCCWAGIPPINGLGVGKVLGGYRNYQRKHHCSRPHNVSSAIQPRKGGGRKDICYLQCLPSRATSSPAEALLYRKWLNIAWWWGVENKFFFLFACACTNFCCCLSKLPYLNLQAVFISPLDFKLHTIVIKMS